VKKNVLFLSHCDVVPLRLPVQEEEREQEEEEEEY
jgi:hypothetical protein